MGLEWIVPYLLVFLQLGVGVALLRTRVDRPAPARLLGALFLLNAAVTALFTLPASGAIYLRSDPGWPTRILRALDAPTGPLLLAFLAVRSQLSARWPIAIVLVVGGVLNGIAELIPSIQLSLFDTYVRAIPYYVAIGLGGYALAGGERWERWVALALLPRGLYWGTGGIIDVVREGLGTDLVVIVNRIGLLLLTVVCIAAASRLVRGARDPLPSVVVPLLAIGPISALAEVLVASSLPEGTAFFAGSVVFLNLVTLGFVRPLVVTVGLLPGSLTERLVEATVVAGAATATAVIVAPLALTGLDIPPGTSSMIAYELGLAGGLLVFGLLQTRGGRVMPNASPEPDAIARDRPQWQLVVLELAGSRLPPDAPNVGEERLTQKGLVKRIGIPAARVSAIVKDLNEGAESRLDGYAPGWRSSIRPAIPLEIVHPFRGAVEGRAGTWLYYRLTPAGELLAEALAARPVIEAAAVADHRPADQ